jgi:hypothetical protein
MPGMDNILNKAYLATGGSQAYTKFQVVKQVSETTLIPAQCALMVSTTDVALEPLGVCMEDLDAAKTNTGKAFINVALEGNVKVIWDGAGSAPTPGAFVKLSALTAGSGNGMVTVATKAAAGAQPVPVVGRVVGILGNSIGATAAKGDWFDIQLTPGGMF